MGGTPCAERRPLVGGTQASTPKPGSTGGVCGVGLGGMSVVRFGVGAG